MEKNATRNTRRKQNSAVIWENSSPLSQTCDVENKSKNADNFLQLR